MKKSTKAALLSALVFPGVGHLFLKKKITGIILIGSSVAIFYYIANQIAQMTTLVLETIQNTAGMSAQPDMQQLRELVMGQVAGADSYFLSLAMSGLMLVWFAGIVDSYRIGFQLDKQESDAPD